MKISLVWLIISFVYVIPWCLVAQNSARDYLNAHNAARARVGVAPLVWHSGLESYARKHLSKFLRTCIPELANNELYGENISSSVDETGHLKEVTGKQVVEIWVEQKQYYNEETNSCVGGRQCINYIQVVWSDTTHVGCARVKCYNGSYMVGCNYRPPAKYLRERPY
ncbi:hypothetical protein PIB30_078385 [Stylosanthes scabra]|uniref:SCP domain-containing protein n=1 Tax=Stylosanthes scabra TaxID=79078 RepID=A0ABU6VQG2_9FABA|nr:hypothetical protein [Stylosanthes scabra]